MAATSTTMDGLAKRIFGELVKPLPEFAIAQELFPFQNRAKIGDEYQVEVVLKRSHGITYQKTNRRTGYALNAARTLQTKPAAIKGAEKVFVDQAAYGQIAAAMEKGQKAYESTMALLLASMIESHRFYIELDMLYGSSPTGIGVLGSVSGSSTTRAWTISAASWATGIWSQMEGAALDCYDTTGVTKRNSNAVVEVVSIDPKNRIVNVSGNSTDLSACVATDFLVPVGARTEAMDGIDYQLLNTGSLYGIDAATYGAWLPNTYDAGSAPATIFTLGTAMKLAVGRGLMGKRCVALVNESVFNDISEDAAGLRRFGDDQKMGVDQGTHKLTFNGSNNNAFEVVSHPMVKQADAFILQPNSWIRGGESDIVDGLPTQASGDQFWFDVPGYALKECRQFSSQFLLGTEPSKQVKVKNIVPRSAV